MTSYDKDFLSIQEARRLAVAARDAQRIWAEASRGSVDRVATRRWQRSRSTALSVLAGWRPTRPATVCRIIKTLKNQFGSRDVWESIKDIKTVGVVQHDPARKLYEIAWPIGVVAALIPSTNPTSTVMVKTLISVKARDAIVIAPHPSAAKCCLETARLMAQAAEDAGAPPGLITCMEYVSLPGTQEPEIITARDAAVQALERLEGIDG